MNIYKEISGQGKDVVILHGWGGCNHKHMQPIVDQLVSRYRVTNFDLPGLGQSDWHHDIQSINDMADQLLSHLPKQAIYIGWSFGGLIAMSIAARYPERISRFIGITTTPKFVANDNWPGVPQPGFKSIFVPGIMQQGFKPFMKTWFDYEFAAFNPKPAAYHDLINILNQDFSKVNLEILFKGVDICDLTDLKNEFKSIQCPVDLILSERDDSVPVAAIEKIKQLNQSVNIQVIPEAGHIPFWTHSKEFNKILNHIL